MDTEKAHYLLDGKPYVMPWSKVDREDPIKWHELILQAPAYSAGYLLRKLPKQLPHPATGKEHTLGLTWDIEWLADEEKYERSMLPHTYADTPEDALAKLCIELFEQGVLTKGGNE